MNKKKQKEKELKINPTNYNAWHGCDKKCKRHDANSMDLYIF